MSPVNCVPDVYGLCETQPRVIAGSVQAVAVYVCPAGAFDDPVKEIVSWPAVVVDGRTAVIVGVLSSVLVPVDEVETGEVAPTKPAGGFAVTVTQ